MIHHTRNSSYLTTILKCPGYFLTKGRRYGAKRPGFILALLILGYAMMMVSCSSMRSNSNVSRKGSPLGDLNLRAQSVSWTTRANYLIFLPKNYHSAGLQNWPVILFLHGIGESGTDLWKTATYGPVRYIEKHPDFPFIVVSPQCPIGSKWSDQAVLKVLEDVISKYAVDTNRIYLTGLSQGGFGVWSLATTYPQYFAAVAPISGGGDVMGFITVKWSKDRVAPLQHLPLWAFHGAKDTVVSVSEDIRMVDALKKFGDRDVKLTIYPDGQHNVWNETYDNPELYHWFLSHQLNANAKN